MRIPSCRGRVPGGPPGPTPTWLSASGGGLGESAEQNLWHLSRAASASQRDADSHSGPGDITVEKRLRRVAMGSFVALLVDHAMDTET